MKKAKPYKVTSKLILKDRAAWRRAFNAPQDVDSIDQPQWDKSPVHRGSYLRRRELILYAAAIAQKHGRLPADCRAYHAAIEQGESLCVEFYIPDTSEFPHARRNVVHVTPRFLDWVPAAPIEETLPA